MSLGYVTRNPVIGRASNRPNERRRSSRYRCSGSAEVLRIPATGITVQATVSDLSLHGCRIFTDVCFESGVPLDLLLRIKSISFRASGHVKVMRGPSEIGVEFTQMSAGGQRRLTELLADLDRIASMAGWKKQASQVIEGECRVRTGADRAVTNAPIRDVDRDSLAPPMPQPQMARKQRLLPARPLEVDVFF
jgi:hypothetical protein